MPFRKTLTALALLLFLFALFCVVVFPGRQTPVAFTFATGLGVANL